MRSKLFTLFLFVILITSISASMQIGNLSHEIQKTYSLDENLKGWINISIEDEDSNSLIESNQDSISLLDLLELNSITDYTCTPNDCESDYQTKNQKSFFSMSRGQEIILGLKFTGMLKDVSSISFNVESNAVASCSNQLKIDILADNEIEYSNNKSAPADCNDFKSYSCYNTSSTTSEVLITETPYCQKFKLRESPSLKAGAWIKKESGNIELKMTLYNTDGEKIQECDLPDATSSGSEISCLLEKQILESKDYYLCVSGTGDGTYKLKKNSNPSSYCGFYGQPVKTPVTAYSIFTIPRAFNSLGNLEITNQLQNQDTFSGLALTYLANKYGFALDCTDTCILPIKLISTTNQDITLSNINAVYSTDQGQEQETKLYELEEIPPEISFDFKKLNLDQANFNLPNSFGNHTFKLEFQNQDIFEEKISIQKLPTIETITPLTTSVIVPTEFIAFVSSENNITKYIWEFADSEKKETTKNRITHSFNETKAYELKLTIVDDEGKNSSKLFAISAGVPRDAANKTLIEKDQYLKNITSQINSYSEFTREQIKTALDLDTKESRIKSLTTKYATAISDDDYIEIMQELIDLEIPKSIIKSQTASELVYLPKEQNIDLDNLVEIADGQYSSQDQDDYIDGVYAWHHENLETKLSYNEFTAIYPHTNEKIITLIDFNVKVKNSPAYKVYFIIDDLQDLQFKQTSGIRDKEGFKYIELNDEQIISFSTTSDLSLNNLPVFISPALSRLDVSPTITPVCNANGKCEEGENWRNCSEDCFPYFWIILIIFFIVFIFLTAYIILQQWYKRNYETHLFKNRTYLFNIVNFVNNSKAKGLTESQIKNKLSKAGWNSEQIAYAMKKYKGKRTGMFEIPVEKVLKIFKKKKTSKQKTPPQNPGFPKDINNYRKFNKGF